MKVLITGGAGFLGMRLARRLNQVGRLTDAAGKLREIEQIILFDQVEADASGGDGRLRSIKGNLGEKSDLLHAVGSGVDSIFHLAAVVSGQAEQDFDLGMRVNVDASRLLLDMARASARAPRVVFTSSVAVYGGVLPERVTDATALSPQSSYGVQKAIGELLLHDYSRKGFVDGRVARLPTITVRPGRPNQAASSFVSSIIREPMSGEPAVCPVRPDTPLWVSSPHAAIENLIRLHELDTRQLGASRSINLPGLSVTPQQMIVCLRDTCGPDYADRVEWIFEQRIQDIVGTWPRAWDDYRARALGMQAEQDFIEIIRQHAKDTDHSLAQEAP